MRIALLSDMHGNDIALKAVLDDIEAKGGADTYWVLGDLVALGHAPIKVIEYLQQLSNLRIIRGNTDRYVCTGARPGPTLEEVRADTFLLNRLFEVEGEFSWTQGAVTTAGWLDWLARLPLEFREQLPDGTRVLCVHSSPNKDDGSGIHQSMSEEELVPLLSNCREKLICVGHTHQPFSIYVNGQHIINPGSVSNPVGKDVRACYAIIEADEDGYKVEFLRVEYNQQSVIELLEGIRHPGRKFIIQHLRGERM